MSSPQQRIRDLYGVSFPDDFFRFAEFMETLPPDILSEALDMSAAYSFDAALGRLPEQFSEHPLWESRYYNDLPEFITIFGGTQDGVHWGYFFDDPAVHPPVVVRYWHIDTFGHTFQGDNIFEAVRYRVEANEVEFRERLDEEGEDEDECLETLEQLAVLRDGLARIRCSDRPETGLDYTEKHDKSRWRTPIAKTVSDLGILVRPDQYRQLSATALGKARSGRIYPQRLRVETLVEEAMRLICDGYPGTALKLGHDLWLWADDYPDCYPLLDAAYAALGRGPLRRLLTEARAYRAWCDASRQG